MAVMLERWNDDKMDALAADVTGLGARVGVLEVKVDGLGVRMDERFGQMDERFGQMDERFVQMDERFVRVEGELREQRKETKEGFEVVHRTIVQTSVALLTAFIVGFASLIALIATQL